jgi:hypothetical protein
LGLWSEVKEGVLGLIRDYGYFIPVSAGVREGVAVAGAAASSVVHVAA